MMRAMGLGILVLMVSFSSAHAQQMKAQAPKAKAKAKGKAQAKSGAARGPLVVTGPANSALASYDRMMSRFMAKNHPPGAAVAVARHGRLVYARGFAYADVEASQPVQPDSLFRIASLAKPFTSVAILQLVERGKLKLNDKMVDVLKLKPTGDHPDKRLESITIRELLHHAGGWDRDEKYDPMGRPILIAEAMHETPPAKVGTIVQFMMGEPLQFDPGQKSVYSNFGYAVLGRVIEKVSGQTYEASRHPRHAARSLAGL
jgi:N-acyl-D-amino-acid deacylase